ncbi:MAG: YHS domain-containing protein, partial [Flavobacteriales bacterium]
AQNENKRVKMYNLNDQIAIQGYDPVAYFKQGRAIKGQKQFLATYEGVVYHFASAANKGLFTNNPLVYEPQYGGWCAFAMGDSGDKVAINPSTFKIIDGKLYLFYNSLFNNTLKTWNKSQTELNKRANLNWKKIIQ